MRLLWRLQLVLREAADVEACGSVRAAFAWLGAPLAAELPQLQEFVLLGSACTQAAWALAPEGRSVRDMPGGGRLWHGSCTRDTLCVPAQRSSPILVLCPDFSRVPVLLAGSCGRCGRMHWGSGQLRHGSCLQALIHSPRSCSAAHQSHSVQDALCSSVAREVRWGPPLEKAARTACRAGSGMAQHLHQASGQAKQRGAFYFLARLCADQVGQRGLPK